MKNRAHYARDMSILLLSQETSLFGNLLLFDTLESYVNGDLGGIKMDRWLQYFCHKSILVHNNCNPANTKRK